MEFTCKSQPSGVALGTKYGPGRAGGTSRRMSTVREPYEHRTNNARAPYEQRANTVRTTREHRTNNARTLYEQRANTARTPHGDRVRSRTRTTERARLAVRFFTGG